jgi:hypothetical protein
MRQGIQQTGVGRDHPNDFVLGTRKPSGVCDLSPKIESAREREDLRERQSFLAKLSSQGKRRLRVQQKSRPDATNLGRR